MWSSRRSFLFHTASLGAATLAFDRAVAQSYPSRPVKLILPSPPGGPQDIAVRTLAERLSLALGQPFVIENLAGGAGGTIGANVVAKAAPDGYTLLGALPAALVAAPALFPNLGFDPARDFLPIGSIFRSPQLLTVHPGLRSIPSAILSTMRKQTRARSTTPRRATALHPSAGRNVSPDDRFDILHVPYKGAVGGITDLLAGRVQMAFQVVPLMAAHVQAGKRRALGVTDDRRSLMLPEVPTTAESGYPDCRQ